MSGPDIKLSSFNSLFGADTTKRIVTLPLSELHQHPKLGVQVQDGPYLDELAESIRKNGLLEDVRAFPDPEGGYWIISGRHRCEAAKRAGLAEVSVILDDAMTQETAEIAITDSNLRHKLGVMEKAWTYRIKREAETRQGFRSDLHGKKQEKSTDSESERTIQRYIRLTYLVPYLRVRTESLGKDKLPIRTGAALSYLPEKMQLFVADQIQKTGNLPDMNTAEMWKEQSDLGILTEQMITDHLSQNEQKKATYSLSLSHKKIAEFLPKEYTKTDAEELMLSLLREWSKSQKPCKKEKI